MAGFISSLGSVYKLLRSALARKGVDVGGTAGYPRVEIHTIIESAPMDKAGDMKYVSAIVECISEKKMQDVIEMNNENLHRMLGESLGIEDGWRVCGVAQGQVQQLTESTETNAILYRLLQNVTIYVERIK